MNPSLFVPVFIPRWYFNWASRPRCTRQWSWVAGTGQQHSICPEGWHHYNKYYWKPPVTTVWCFLFKFFACRVYATCLSTFVTRLLDTYVHANECATPIGALPQLLQRTTNKGKLWQRIGPGILIFLRFLCFTIFYSNCVELAVLLFLFRHTIEGNKFHTCSDSAEAKSRRGMALHAALPLHTRVGSVKRLANVHM